MLGLKLFLGFERDALFERELQRANPTLVSLLMQGEPYLTSYDNYLGKYLPPSPTVEQIELHETHLVSLLKKLAPGYPYSQNPLLLLTLHE